MKLQFIDGPVTYSVFVHDVAAKVAELIKTMPEFICQNEAFRRFGRANVERWRRQGKIEPHKRPGKIEYRYVELVRARDVVQDYFD